MRLPFLARQLARRLFVLLDASVCSAGDQLSHVISLPKCHPHFNSIC